MKKAYFLLIGLLILIVLAFTYARSYLSRLESDNLRIKTELGRRQLIDSLQQTFEMMALDRTGDIQRSYDSLVRESDALIYALESQLDLYLNPEYDPVASVADPVEDPDLRGDPEAQDDKPDSVRADSNGVIVPDTSKSLAADSVASIKDAGESDIIPHEYEVYIAYLDRIAGLPKDLTSYEKKVAYDEAERNLAAEYSVTRGDIRKILKKLREYSISKRNDG
jgi:hypothetical protein